MKPVSIVRVGRSGKPDVEFAMTVKTHQPAGSRPDRVKQASKDDPPKPVVSMIRELGLKVCPISERIIKGCSDLQRRSLRILRHTDVKCTLP